MIIASAEKGEEPNKEQGWHQPPAVFAGPQREEQTHRYDREKGTTGHAGTPVLIFLLTRQRWVANEPFSPRSSRPEVQGEGKALRSR